MQVAEYLSLGKVYIIGDLNSRANTQADFIEQDNFHCSIVSRLDNTYVSDSVLHSRTNPDQYKVEMIMEISCYFYVKQQVYVL